MCVHLATVYILYMLHCVGRNLKVEYKVKRKIQLTEVSPITGAWKEPKYDGPSLCMTLTIWELMCSSNMYIGPNLRVKG